MVEDQPDFVGFVEHTDGHRGTAADTPNPAMNGRWDAGCWSALTAPTLV